MKALSAMRERSVSPGVIDKLTVQIERTTNRFTVHKLGRKRIHTFCPIASERFEIDNDNAVEKALKKEETILANM